MAESLLAMARRHVIEGEARVTAQAALVEDLRRRGLDVVAAEDLLATLRDILQQMREHLALEESKAT